MELNTLLGASFVMGIFLYVRKQLRERKHLRQQSGELVEAKKLVLDASVRKNAEKAMRKQGVIGGSALNAPRGFEAAYLRVMTDVKADNRVKADLYVALAHDNSISTYEQFLLSGRWGWPEFEKWKAVFLKDGDFPYMWKKYPELCMADFSELRLRTMLEQTLVRDIKNLLQKLEIDIPPKSKKAELIELAEQKISIEMFRETCPDIYEDIKKKFEKRVNHGKCAILEHTITILGYNLRIFYSCNKLKLDVIGNCPVETKYAKDKGGITEYSIPPFFPGDRTGVRFDIHKR